MTLRRDFLAFTAGAVATRTVIPTIAHAEGTNPDATLIALCREYTAIEFRMQALAIPGPHFIADDEEYSDTVGPLWAREAEIAATLANAVPQTREGLVALATAIVGFDTVKVDEWRDRVPPTMIRSLLRGLVGGVA